jgi:hypothetical protein
MIITQKMADDFNAAWNGPENTRLWREAYQEALARCGISWLETPPAPETKPPSPAGTRRK